MLTGLFVCPARVSLLLRVGGRSTCVLRSKQKFGHLGRLTSKVALYHISSPVVPRHHALHTHSSDGLPSNLSSVSVCSTSLKAAAPTRPMLFHSKSTSLRCLRSLSAPAKATAPSSPISLLLKSNSSNFSKRRKEPARSRISLSVQSKPWEDQLGAAASDVVEEALVQVRHDCLVRVRRKLLLGVEEVADDVWPEGHAATVHATPHDSLKVLVHDQVPGTVQLQGSRVEPRAAHLDDGTDRRFHETPPALSVRRGGEPWRKVRLDQDRREGTAVPHVARPQTLAEQRLLIGVRSGWNSEPKSQKTAQSSTLAPTASQQTPCAPPRRQRPWTGGSCPGRDAPP